MGIRNGPTAARASLAGRRGNAAGWSLLRWWSPICAGGRSRFVH